MTASLHSTNHLEVAHALKDIAIASIRARDAEVADRLEVLMNAIWIPGAQQPAEKQTALFEEVLTGLNPGQYTQMLEGYARMGHLYEIAGLAARENYFAANGAPGGPKEAIAKYETAEDARKALEAPVFEMILTQHPTNTSSLAFIRAQRRIGQALAAKDSVALEREIGDFFNPEETPLLHRRGTADVYFTVRDETDIVLNALGNIYEDLPQVYAKFDAPLTEKFKAEYRPEALKLNLRLGSWGSAGDKDGNDSITAEATLQAIGLHKEEILARYVQDLDALRKKIPPGGALETDVLALQGQLASVLEGKGGLHALNAEIEKRRGECEQDEAKRGRFLISEDEFQNFSSRMKELNDRLPPLKDFVTDLQALYVNAQEQQPEVLNLLRRARLFGFDFAKLEYREKAEEYSRVAGLVVDGYAALSEEEKQAKLEALIAHPEQLQALLDAKRDVVSAGAERAYDKTDVGPIAYHTLKRMELARDFPGMVQDNVLAECQGATHMLEAKLIQRLGGALLGIIPLFEDPEAMERVEGTMREVYQNPTYRAHLQELTAARGGTGVMQQMQIAHSDNARRAGSMAARGYIHRAHQVMRALHEKEFPDIGLQFYEGGSISDAYRNGLRAVSGMVDDFQIYDFAKFTFQGGDLVNYLNHPGSIARLISRSIGHQARRKWQIANPNGNGKEDAPPVSNGVADDVAINALILTLGQYEHQDFDAADNPMGATLKLLDFDGEARAGNRGSRAAVRGGEKADPTQPVAIKDLRTISFSEAWQHEGIIPIWIGADLQTRWLFTAITKKCEELRKKDTLSPDEKQFFESFSDIAQEGLWPRHVRALYDQSRVFKDAMDRMAYGVAMTDTGTFHWLNHLTHEKQNTLVGQVAHGYLHRLVDTYNAVAPLAQAALTKTAQEKQDEQPVSMLGKILEAPRRAWSDVLTYAAGLQEKTPPKLSRMQEQIGIKRAYRDFLLHVRRNLAHEGPEDDAYWHLRGVIHNAGDTVVHGRVLPADDPAYGESLMKGPKNGNGRAGEPQMSMGA